MAHKTIYAHAYLCSHVACKAKNAAQRDANDVVTCKIDISNKCLPSAPNSHSFKR